MLFNLILLLKKLKLQVVDRLNFIKWPSAVVHMFSFVFHYAYHINAIMHMQHLNGYDHLLISDLNFLSPPGAGCCMHGGCSKIRPENYISLCTDQAFRNISCMFNIGMDCNNKD